MSLLVLSAADVQRITASLAPHELQLLMARVFAFLSSQPSVEAHKLSPPRLAVPTANHNVLFMPARMPTDALTGTTVKVVSVPRSPGDRRGLPASTLVLDEDTGAVKAVVNARDLTALRNAAGSLLSTNLVGQRGPRAIVAFGAGKQIETHLTVHLKFFHYTVTSCTIVNRSLNPRVDTLLQTLTARFPAVSFELIVNSAEAGFSGAETADQESLRHALAGADIIVCATSSTVPLFPSAWVRARTHIILIGSYTPAMREAEGELLRRATPPPRSSRGVVSADEAGRVHQALLVDSREACLAEAGELIQAGVRPDEMVEIGELLRITDEGEVMAVLPSPGLGENLYRALDLSEPKLTSHPAGVAHAEEGTEIGTGPITMFKSVGLGLQDVAIACAVVDKAERDGRVGTKIDHYDN